MINEANESSSACGQRFSSTVETKTPPLGNEEYASGRRKRKGEMRANYRGGLSGAGCGRWSSTRRVVQTIQNGMLMRKMREA